MTGKPVAPKKPDAKKVDHAKQADHFRTLVDILEGRLKAEQARSVNLEARVIGLEKELGALKAEAVNKAANDDAPKPNRKARRAQAAKTSKANGAAQPAAPA